LKRFQKQEKMRKYILILGMLVLVVNLTKTDQHNKNYEQIENVPLKFNNLEVKCTSDKSGLSKEELIDAIASGSKLTKADAG
jgi:hypothetical protein